MKTPEEIKRGMEHCAEIGCKGCPYEEDCNMFDRFSIPAEDAYFYIQQLEKDNAQKDEHIMWLEMMNAEYKHVLGYIKHAADMGVHGDADALAMFGINMGRGAEEEAEK